MALLEGRLWFLGPFHVAFIMAKTLQNKAEIAPLQAQLDNDHNNKTT